MSGDDKDRDGKIGQFASQAETQVLCNCALLTEGFDHPPTAAIVLSSPHEKPVRSVLRWIGQWDQARAREN